MSLLTDFIEKQLQDKKQQRWVIQSKDLFDLWSSMGIMEEEELLMNILEYLEENKIDVHFENSTYEAQFKTFKKLEQGYQIRKRMKGKIDETKKYIEKVMSYKPNVDDTFLLEYMTDDEEEQKEVRVNVNDFNKDLQTMQENVTKQIQQEMLENAPPIDRSVIEYIRNNS
jgi:hypothetical protein